MDDPHNPRGVDIDTSAYQPAVRPSTDGVRLSIGRAFVPVGAWARRSSAKVRVPCPAAPARLPPLANALARRRKSSEPFRQDRPLRSASAIRRPKAVVRRGGNHSSRSIGCGRVRWCRQDSVAGRRLPACMFRMGEGNADSFEKVGTAACEAVPLGAHIVPIAQPKHAQHGLLTGRRQVATLLRGPPAPGELRGGVGHLRSPDKNYG